MRTPVFIAIALMFAGCVAQPERIAYNSSGKPEIIIATNDIAAIKTAIIADLIDDGYTVEKDSDLVLELTRPAKGPENLGAALSIGNSYSTNTRVVNYMFLKQDGSVRIIVSNLMRVQMTGGQTRSGPLEQNNLFNMYQKQLNEIKEKLEKK